MTDNKAFEHTVDIENKLWQILSCYQTSVNLQQYINVIIFDGNQFNSSRLIAQIYFPMKFYIIRTISFEADYVTEDFR